MNPDSYLMHELNIFFKKRGLIVTHLQSMPDDMRKGVTNVHMRLHHMMEDG